MSPTLNTVIAWSYGLAGVLYLVFALRVLAARGRGLRAWTLLAASAFVAVWGLAVMVYTRTGWISLLTLSSFADTLAYAAWYAFLLVLAGRLPRPAGQHWYGDGLLVAGMLVTAFSLGAHMLALAGSTDAAGAVRMVLLAILANAVFGLVLVEQVYRGVADESRWGVTPLCLALVASFAFDVYTFADALLFSGIDPDVWSVRGVVRVLAVPLIAISLARTRGGRTGIVLSRQIVFRSTALAMSGVYLLVMAGAGYYVRYFGGEWGRALQVALLFAAFLLLVVLLFSGSIRAKLRVTINKNFFRYRYDYREEWLRFTQALSSRGEPAEVGRHVVMGLANMVESPAGALWLRDAPGRSFTPAARWNMQVTAAEDADSELVRFLASSGWVINLEEYRSSPDRYGTLRLPTWLSEIGSAWLVIPLAIASDLTGFVVLATARTPVVVDWEVNDLLKMAGRQAASFLGHIQATEALLEARKFEAFNRLSAFVVHDLKNIVAQLSLMVRNAERHHDNPEFQRDMLMTVEHSVERMKQLMLQLRDGTTPLDVTHPVDLADLAVRIQRAKAGQSPAVDVEVEARVAAKGHPERLDRVVGHLVQNAIDATGGAGRVWIRIGQQGQHALVEVGDTGHGMTPEFVRERLFKPFQTTKQTGMGIGAYESHQYVHELGGRVLVDSTPGVGTRVSLLLPLFEVAGSADAERRRVA